jgi:hypothetical protein
MESKIKCDRQYPCSKCATRGKDCVFTGPGRRASVATRPIPTPQTVSTYRDSSSEASSVTPSNMYIPAPEASNSYSNGPFHILEQDEAMSSSMSMPSFSDAKSFPSSIFNASSSMADLYSSAASDVTTTHESEHLPVHSHLSSVYTSDMFEPFFSNIFSQPPPTLPITDDYTTGWAEIGLRTGSPEDVPFAGATPPRAMPNSGSFEGAQGFEAALPEAQAFTSSPTLRAAQNDAQLSPISEGANIGPNGPELQHYRASPFRVSLLDLTIQSPCSLSFLLRFSCTNSYCSSYNF